MCKFRIVRCWGKGNEVFAAQRIAARMSVFLFFLTPHTVMAETFLIGCEGDAIIYSFTNTEDPKFLGLSVPKIIHENGILKIFDEKGKQTLIGPDPEDMRCHSENQAFCDRTSCLTKKIENSFFEGAASKCKNASNFSNICAFSTDLEITAGLSQRDFRACVSIPNDVAFSCNADDGREVVFRKSIITFNCKNFNTCSYSVRELGKLLITQKLVDTLERDLAEIEGGPVEQYCGRGKAGEKICILEDVFTREAILVLHRAEAKSTPSFE